MDVRLKQGLQTRTLPNELLIDGPAGTGKTYGVLSVLHCLCRDYPKLRVLICRATRASLTESALATYEEEVLPGDGCEWIAQGVRRSNRVSYHYPNKSLIVPGGLDKPERILSSFWDIIFVNEACETVENSWQMLGTRLDRPGTKTRFGYLLADTNPGDPEHWLARRVRTGRLAYWYTTHAANPALFDRAGWTTAWDRYRARLGNLVGNLRKRLFDGLWVAGEGAWFDTFDTAKHRSTEAEYDSRWPVHLAIDTGSETGAVWFQVRQDGEGQLLTVFGDYYSNRVHAFENGKRILARSVELCGGRVDVTRHDLSGNADVGFGGTTIATEFERAGLKSKPWVRYPGSVSARLALLESFVATETTRFLVHPRCGHLINALANYKRKQRGGQWIDEPEEPQHPYEELIDALSSGLLDKWPHGRKPDLNLPRINARRVF